jgi:hypothetical protein
VRSSPFRLAAVVCLAVLGSACSGDPPGGANVGGDNAGGDGNGVGGADSQGGASGNNSQGGFGGDIFGGGGSDNVGNCQPTSCEAQGKSCGAIADGCGSVIDCGGCGDGTVCGLAEANVCAGIEDICVRLSQEAACADKQCGVEGDGCGGTIDCGTCPDGQGCGLVEAYQCATIPGGSPSECAARILSCDEVGANCGKIGNGCGGTIDCDAEFGGCPTGELCGADEDLPQQCAPFAACQPIAPVDACAGKCGIVSNGCGLDVDGGTIDCEEEGLGCTLPATCGGGGVPFQCGQGGITECTETPQVDACGDFECGFVADGCGDTYDCSNGNSCAAGTTCRAGQCVAIVGCTALTESAACGAKECGTVGDNCGGTYECGSNGGGCAGGRECGAINPFECDFPPNGGAGCDPRTQQAACAGKECGIAYDGCGTDPENTFECGSNNGDCPSGQFCGAQAAYQCDPLPTPPACVPNADTCQTRGFACGTLVGNCGQLIPCGSCNSTQTCVGGITNGTTCASVLGDDEDDCPLCAAVPACSGQPTRLTGRVIAPGQTDALTANHVRVPNAFVYILRTNDETDLPPIGTGLPTSNGLSCDRCEDQDLGPVLVGDVTDANGDFTLESNIPIGQPFLLVTKVGKFRRAQRMTLPAEAECETTALPTAMSSAGGELAGQGATDNPTRLPRSMTDGLAVNIPRIAVTTGVIDAMECVFYKMGLASTEFGNFEAGTPTHRVDLYRGASSGSPQGASINVSTPHDATLYNDITRLEKYDMVVSDCEGGNWDSGPNFTQRGNGDDSSQGGKVRQYVNRGGRLFLSHLSFTWLTGNGATVYNAATPLATGLGPVGTWQDNTFNTDTVGTGLVSSLPGRPRTSPRIETFADWVSAESVLRVDQTFRITDPRSQNLTINAGTEEFVFRSDAASETGVTGYNGAGNGRVQQFSFNTPFGAPSDAACGRVAYSGFHVAATSGQGTTPFATQIFPAHCNSATLGNSGVLTAQEKILLFMLFDLGTCVGEEPEPPVCTPLECDTDQCGILPDGCGGTMDCEGCAAGQVCDDNLCRVQCVPTTCEAENIACSTIADGCGDVLECDCNACIPDDETVACAPDKCGFQSDGCSGVVFCGDCPTGCDPIDECPANLNCGVVGDGCNSVFDCGSCETGDLCGAHDANVCDPPSCRPLACYQIEPLPECGLVGDGCGATIPCGSCGPGQICTVVNGVPNKCAGCAPKTQQLACAGLECGLVGDGCGGTYNCGTCVAGEYCGSITPNMCDPGPQCTPRACPSGAQCGVVGDGCGGSVTCGTCPAGQLCGVFEPYKCGGCTPQTCETAGAQCGEIGDGCGGELDCGDCSPGFICGLGQPNKCGQLR